MSSDVVPVGPLLPITRYFMFSSFSVVSLHPSFLNGWRMGTHLADLVRPAERVSDSRVGRSYFATALTAALVVVRPMSAASLIAATRGALRADYAPIVYAASFDTTNTAFLRLTPG